MTPVVSTYRNRVRTSTLKGERKPPQKVTGKLCEKGAKRHVGTIGATGSFLKKKREKAPDICAEGRGPVESCDDASPSGVERESPLRCRQMLRAQLLHGTRVYLSHARQYCLTLPQHSLSYLPTQSGMQHTAAKTPGKKITFPHKKRRVGLGWGGGGEKE